MIFTFRLEKGSSEVVYQMILYYREEKRTANIVADDSDGQGVTCLVIDRESFHHLKDLDDIKNRYIDLPERKKM